MGEGAVKRAGGAGPGGVERRQQPRVRASLACHWGWDEHAAKSGTVSSLSAGGCFVVTKAPGIRGSEVHVHLWLPSFRWLKLRGRVLHEVEGAGLGITFEGVSEQELVELMWLVDHLWQQTPPAAGDGGPQR